MTQLSTPAVTLTDEQQSAVTTIVQHFRDKKKQAFSLGGFAGTGKTTVIKAVIAELVRARPCPDCFGRGLILHEDKEREICEEDQCRTCDGYGTVGDEHRPICSAFTGKAVSVLRRKGLIDSQTLHSLMYHVEKDEKGKLVFYKRQSIEPDYVIVDEASMLNTILHNDLLSFNLPVLFVGDPGQLPPVGDNPNVMAKPDIILSKIHRQAELNPIIRFASDLRTGRMWDYGQHKMADGDGIALDIRNKSSSMDVLLEVDQVITAFNKRRLEINRLLLETYKFTDPVTVGNKLICLRNNRELGLFNGLMLWVTKVHPATPTCYRADLVDELGTTWNDVHMLKKGFNGGFDTKNDVFPSGKEVTLFDYGYCITCHKSQGSEWDSVLVLEQYGGFAWDMSRWQYTSATRASKKLIYVR